MVKGMIFDVGGVLGHSVGWGSALIASVWKLRPAVIRQAAFRRGPEARPTDKIVDLFTLNIVWESFVNVPPNRAIPALGEIVLVKESLAHLRGQGYDEQAALSILNQWQLQRQAS